MAQTAYLRYVDMHATLAADDTLFAGDDLDESLGTADNSNASGIRLPGSLDVTSSGHTPMPVSKGTRALLLTAIAALIIGTIIAVPLLMSSKGDFPTLEPDIPIIVTPSFALASVTRTHQAVWTNDAPPPADITDPVPLSLKSGLIQIELNSGVIILAEGPLEAELISATAFRIERGKIRVIVPPQANGVTIYTRNVKVSGTECEFGVSMNGIDQGEVHAFTGPLDFIPSARGGQRVLKSGEAVSFSTNEQASVRPNARPANPSEFIGLRELDEQARNATENQYNQWVQHCRELQSDPSLLVHYTFENFNPWDRTVTNMAPIHGRNGDGAMVGCKWTRGRWPEKGAADFHRVSHRIRLNVNKEETDAFSLLEWVYIPAQPESIQMLLSSPEPTAPGNIAPDWALGKNGNILLTLRQSNKQPPVAIRSRSVLKSEHIGRWLHLAVTCTQSRATFYINGKNVHSQAFSPVLNARFHFGRIDLGNRTYPNPKKGKEKSKEKGKDKNKESSRAFAAPFIGLLDEFQLITKALTDDEIEQSFKAGSPEL